MFFRMRVLFGMGLSMSVWAVYRSWSFVDDCAVLAADKTHLRSRDDGLRRTRRHGVIG